MHHNLIYAPSWCTSRIFPFPLFLIAASFLVWVLIKQSVGIRVSEEEEYEGLDIGECGMEAYPEFTSAQ